MALQDPETDALLPGMDHDSRMASWHLVDDGGRVHSAGRAFAPLMRLLPAGAPVAALAERFPRAFERGYFWVAERRASFGRLVTGGARRRADRRIAARAANR